MWYAMASISVHVRVCVLVCMCCLVFLVYWANSITNKSVRQAVKKKKHTHTHNKDNAAAAEVYVFEV